MPTIQVKGMHCGNCRNAVTKALLGMEGVKSAEVDLETGIASWENVDESNPVSLDEIKKTILGIGFEPE